MRLTRPGDKWQLDDKCSTLKISKMTARTNDDNQIPGTDVPTARNGTSVCGTDRAVTAEEAEGRWWDNERTLTEQLWNGEAAKPGLERDAMVNLETLQNSLDTLDTLDYKRDISEHSRTH